MAYLHKFNYDDVFLRAVSVAILDLLSNNISIWNRLSDSEIQDIQIPFYYDGSGDERFMQDYFLSDTYDDCIDIKKVEGNIDVIPRGTIKLDSCTINVATFTNRFVYGDYVEENEDGTITTYSAPVMIVPLDIIYSVSIELDSYLDLLKTLQRVIESFYKVVTINALYNGMVIQISVAFPEDTEIAKTYEFSYGDMVDNKLNFSIAVESYLPVIDYTNRRLKTNVIENITMRTQPVLKPFPTYVIPEDKRAVTKSGFTVDDTPFEQINTFEKLKNHEDYKPPISDKDFNESEVVYMQQRNLDGSIGTPGTEDYIDSYGRDYWTINNLEKPGTVPPNKQI